MIVFVQENRPLISRNGKLSCAKFFPNPFEDKRNQKSKVINEIWGED
jgi:hypothetical protein